jgi:hypothetical protein
LTGEAKRRAALKVFALFSLMSLLDRQGFFYAATGFAVLAGSALVNRSQWRLVAAGGAAVACMVVYDVWLGPLIVNAVNHYVPSLAYQSLPADQLTQSATPYARASELLAESATVLFGSFSMWIAGLAIAALVTAAAWKTGPGMRGRLLLVATVAFLLATSVVMFALMVVRHPPIYEWIDHRYWYYPLPFQALLICLTVILLDRIMHRWTGWKPVLLNAAIAIAIAGNVAHWGMYRDRMLTSRWFSRIYPQTAILQSSIAEGRPDPRLIRQYREFFELCARLSPGLGSRLKQ